MNNKQNMLLILIFVLMIVFCLQIYNTYISIYKVDNFSIPVNNNIDSHTFDIWMYWENKSQTKKPIYLNICYDTVLYHCSDKFNIHLLNEKSIYDYLPNLRSDLDKRLNIPQKADYIRYNLLYKYGGIWLDSDIIIMNSLESLIQKLRQYDYVGAGCHYNNCKDNGYPYPANWVMVSRSHTRFMKMCIDRCDYILDSIYRYDSSSMINYHIFGRDNLWNNIKILKLSNWDYYHYDSKCLERDSKYRKITNERLLSNEQIDQNCINNLLYIPIYNTAPGFPKWFIDMNYDDIIYGKMLISRLFRKSLNIKINTDCYTL